MSPSIGAALRAGREQRHLTLAQVSEATRVRIPYLQALENDDLSAMPSVAQGRGFMRIYAQFLELDLEALIPPPAPTIATAPDGPTAPVKPAAPEPASAESGPSSKIPSILTGLRDNLSRRLRRHSANPTDDRSDIASGADSPDKKKSPPLEATESSTESELIATAPAETAPFLDSAAESPSALEEGEGTPTGQPADMPRASIQQAVRGWLTAIFRGPRVSPDVAKAVDDEPEREGSRSALPLANAVDFNPLPSDIDAEPESSDEIFAEIGRQLRARREMLSLTFEEIERHTHVRASFLKGLEDGKLDGLPSPVQTRGILANYAAFIDLNADSIMLRFADGIQARHREQRPQWPPRTHSPMTVHSSLPPLRTFIASDLLFGGGAAIMLILFAVWGINRVVTLRSAESQGGGSPSIPEVLAQAPLPTVLSEITLIPAVDTPLAPTVEVTPQQAPTSIDPSITVQVKLSASERTYLRVTVDDKPTFEGRTEPGKDYYYQGARQIEVVVGNAAALRVTHNGADRGTLGGLGQVVDQLYTSRGVFTPTPTTPPTATPSATPTSTLKATPTLATFTPTPHLGE